MPSQHVCMPQYMLQGHCMQLRVKCCGCCNWPAARPKLGCALQVSCVVHHATHAGGACRTRIDTVRKRTLVGTQVLAE